MLTNDAGDGSRRQPATGPEAEQSLGVCDRTEQRALRAQWIERLRLVEQLDRSARFPVVLISAPAGYGKSTLVTQWAARADADATARISLESADNDPTRLWTHLLTALQAAGCEIGADAAALVARNVDLIPTQVIPRVVDSLAGRTRPLAVVLDDCHLLRSQTCCDQLDLLIDRLPTHVAVVLVSRSDPLLRLGRLRVDGRLAEIRTGDLSFTASETRALLAAAGISLTESSLTELLRRTEGWPAALYLACLSLAGREDTEEFVRRLSGSHRFIADYLGEEVLGRQDADLRSFTLDMSIFDRFDVALADVVTGTNTARGLLDRLERTNLFLIRDPATDSFRFHRLFATFAQAALEIEHPERVLELHRRGAAWFAEHDRLDDAIRHAVAGRDLVEAARMVQANWIRYFDAGRTATVLSWLDAFRGSEVDDTAPVTVTAAWMAALTGNEQEMRRRLARLAAPDSGGPMPDGTSSPEAALLLIRGLFGYDGPEQMMADARQAVALETSTATPWYSVARAALGYAGFVVGDPALARDRLTEAAHAHRAPATIRVLALGTLSLCEAEQGRSDLSASLAAQAMQVVTEHGMENRPQSTFAYTAVGRWLADADRLPEAADLLARGLAPRRRIPGLSPWPLLHHLLVMAEVAARGGRQDDAERLLAEIVALVPWTGASMSTTRARIDRVRRLLRCRPVELDVLGDPLTPRELEILHRLQGAQTLREIAADLYVSHNTVKTITLSVYRKLGVHTRAEAVALGRQCLSRSRSRVSPG